jgi:hypothetical protein
LSSNQKFGKQSDKRQKITKPIKLKSVFARVALLSACERESEAKSAVLVVPTFEPMTIARAAGIESKPCEAKMMLSPVVAELDCTTIVTTMPIREAVYFGKKI